MARNGYRVMDSDIHVVEPADLWERYLESPFRSRVRARKEYVGDARVEIDGRLFPPRETVHLFTHPSTRHRRERYRYFHERGWTPEAQIEAMEREGVDVAVVFTNGAILTQSVDGFDPELGAAFARAYNDWLRDFCRHDPERLLGAGMISPFDVGAAVAEARRGVEELGFRAVLARPNPVNGRNWHDPCYEPLWTELEGLGIPLCFHEGGAPLLPQVGSRFGNNWMLRHTACHPMEQMLAVISVCAGGVLQRHPRLRVAFLEGNCSWAPFLLWRMDEQWELMGEVYAPDLEMPPSAYFRRQCYVSVECDEVPAAAVLPLIGDGNLVFSTDFPDADSKFPRSVERFLQLPIPEESKRKILWDNCARLYDVARASPRLG